MGIDECFRGSKAATEDSKPRSGPAQTPAHGHQVPGLGTRASDRRPALEVPQRGHRDHDRLSFGGVTSDEHGVGRCALLGKACGHLVHPGTRGVRRCHESHKQSCGDGTHRIDIGQTRCCSAAADVDRRRPIPAEVPTLDENVHASNHSIIGRAHHSCIITGSEFHEIARNVRRFDNAIDGCELPNVP